MNCRNPNSRNNKPNANKNQHQTLLTYLSSVWYKMTNSYKLIMCQCIKQWQCSLTQRLFSGCSCSLSHWLSFITCLFVTCGSVFMSPKGIYDNEQPLLMSSDRTEPHSSGVEDLMKTLDTDFDKICERWNLLFVSLISLCQVRIRYLSSVPQFVPTLFFRYSSFSNFFQNVDISV